MAAKENVPFLLLLFIILFVEQVSIFGENFLTINKRGNDLINTRRKEFVFLVDAYYSYFQISFAYFSSVLLNICIRKNLIIVF